jgi:protein O-mannosyl-transferase
MGRTEKTLQATADRCVERLVAQDFRAVGRANAAPSARLRSRQPAHGQPDKPRFWAVLALCVLLLLAVALVFGQTLDHGFINYDDDLYVSENPHVADGLTLHGIGWAFTHFHSSNWHPVTWLSHMLDCQLCGLNPWGHHLHSMLLHALTAILMFLVLLRATGAFWPSALAAALFAVHPLRVESVAWVAERKDVLSGFLGMLTLAAYVAYARRSFSIGWYFAVVLLFALGLMAKPMLVTLPFVLLLLDYWPLGRWGRNVEACQAGIEVLGQSRFCLPRRLLIEKIPLFALSAASCVVTIIAQQKAMEWTETLPLRLRIANALVAYVAYIGKAFCPVGLAVFYPHPAQSLLYWQVSAALLVLIGISAAAIVWGRKHPYLLVGWFWYAGMLVPVAGLVQVGSQAMADRYTYLPQIGLYILVAWAVADLSRRWRFAGWLCGPSAVGAVLILIGIAWGQTAYWHDSESLWRRALACTSSNAYAHSNLGVTLGQQAKTEEAIEHLRQAIQFDPGYVKAYINLGVALGQQGKLQEALVPLQKALQMDPGNALACSNLSAAFTQMGVGLLREGKAEPAIAPLEKALELNPRNTDACNALGSVYYQQGKFDEALCCFRRAAEIDARQIDARQNIGTTLLRQGKVMEALAEWRELLSLQPQHLAGLLQTAWMLATWPDASIRNGSEALALAQRAVEVSSKREPAAFDALAAAYAESGQFPEAIQAAQHAVTLLQSHQHHHELSRHIHARLKLYQSGCPYRESMEP